MLSLWQELRYTARRLRKSPGFTLTAVLTLAIGIAGNTAIFSVMDAIVLRPLAVPEMDRVVNVSEARGTGADYTHVALANYRDWRSESHSFESISARADAYVSLTGSGEPEHANASFTSASFFQVFRSMPLLGRVYTAQEEQPGRDVVAVLSYALWQRRFAGSSAVLGKPIELDHRRYTVIGVMPRDFRYPRVCRLWAPLAPSAADWADRTGRNYLVSGRLRPAVTVAAAQSEIRTIAARLARQYPNTNVGWGAHVALVLHDINGSLTADYMKMMLGATLFVLLVVCANVANLQFARGLSRRAEVAVRGALGASRWQLIRQLLVENLVLALLGALVGIALADVDLRLIKSSMPEAVARYVAGWNNIGIDGRVLVATCVVAALAGIVAGLSPAIATFRVDLIDALRSGTRSVSASAAMRQLRNIFVVVQITFALTLVVGSSLMVKGMWTMTKAADIYSPAHQILAEIDLPLDRYPGSAARSAWFEQSRSRLQAVPGVASVETTTAMPYSNGGPWVQDFTLDRQAAVPGVFHAAQRVTVSRNFLPTFGIALASGRYFNRGDGLRTQPVALVSRKFADRYFPGNNPIGHQVKLSGDADPLPGLTIVGVVDDVMYSWTDKYAEPAVYLNASQFPSPAVTFVIRSDSIRPGVLSDVRKTFRSLDPLLPIDRLQTYAEYFHEALVGLNYVVVMLLIDALIALLLCSVGVFAVVATTVAERTREIGIRIAVGAQRGEILGLVLRRSLVLTSIGLGIGVPLALGLTSLLSSLFYGVDATDTGALLLTIFVISGVSLGASYLAGRRAAGIDPIRALQSQ